MSEIKNSNEVSTIKENIKKLNLGQVSELIDGLKKDLNIQETAIVQSVAAQTEEKVEKKNDNVSLKLLGMKEEGLSKIPILGIIMEAVKDLKHESINIIQAKKLTEKEDKIILENVPRDKVEGEEGIQAQLEKKGAKVKIIEIE